MRTAILVVPLSVLTFGTAFAATCDNYPYGQGMSIEGVAEGIKIVATASVGVSYDYDDVDAVNDARDEATMSAKSLIARFLSEDIKSDDKISHAVHEDKSLQGDARQARRTEIVDRVKRLSDSSSALLRGVVPLGDCYTPGREMRVSVGLKPETIAAAGNLSSRVGQAPAPPSSTGPAAEQTPTTGPAGSQPLIRVPGFSNTQQLNKF
jgi:hypothetical protein